MAMFESLSDRLQGIFQRIGNRGRLTEKDIDEAMREVRRALIEADVNLGVVKEFIAAVKERALGAEVLKSLSPGQQVIKIVHEELINLLGNDQVPLVKATQPPSVIMLVGLQGAGKTTHAAKLAVHLRKQGQTPLLVAADVYRPAAVNQLQALGKQINLPVYDEGVSAAPPQIVERALRVAREKGNGTVIIDTAGRLQINEQLMQELEDVKAVAKPDDILLVADAMTGQEAVNVAREFNERVGLTGVLMTKMDGDARGGAALSIRRVTGVPIKFLGTGEKVDALEPYYPDRLASRILGMGDVLSLIEKAQQQFDADQAKEMEKKVLAGRFDLEDFLNQLQQVKQMGPLNQLLEMIPGLGTAARKQDVQVSDDDLKHIEAIIRSMTPQERRSPQLIKGSRRRRIANGSGTSIQEVNELLNQFKQMQRMMASLGKGGLAGLGGGKRGRFPGMPF
ncbi:MAG TPA: signal recognition particle protein [Thermomicrobiales bacterium]|jgi:signal recognition particle subunit SRP54|nr:signal recognition particle protein [Thermomicrobiales bacterium]